MSLQLDLTVPIQVFNAGLFVSRGRGRHPDRVFPYYDLIFVRSGRLGIQEEDRPFTVDAGESVLLWPERRHFGTLDYEDDLSFYWIHFLLNEKPLRPNNGGPEDLPPNPGAVLVDVPQHVAIARPEALMELFRRFLDDQEAGALEPATSNLQMMLMLAEVARSTEGGASTQPSTALAGRAATYIRAHFHDQVSASMVADAVGCNPNYLARVFREAYGKTLTDEIHDCRLREARRLLIDGVQNVDEISRLCGFTDDVYFRRLFKRAHGMTPLAFRRLYARVHVNTE
jgi:AraC-like DNA-binding protein